MLAILKEHRHCINCLKPGHFIKQCPCSQWCRKCQKPHHTWLHIANEAPKQAKEGSPSKQTSGTVTHHSQSGGRHPVVPTTYQVQIVSADGSTTKARALLNSASSTPFIMESLAQRLHLRRRRHFMKVGVIGGSATKLSSCEMVDLNILNGHGKTMALKEVVLPQVTTDLPSCSVPFNYKRKHLSNIRLADLDFGTQGVLICS